MLPIHFLRAGEIAIGLYCNTISRSRGTRATCYSLTSTLGAAVCGDRADVCDAMQCWPGANPLRAGHQSLAGRAPIPKGRAPIPCGPGANPDACVTKRAMSGSSKRRVGKRQTPVHWNGARLEPDWRQTGARMEPEWNQNGARMEAKWNQNGARMEQEWNQNGTRMEPTWNQNDARMGPEWN